MDKTEENNMPQTPAINIVENNLTDTTDVKSNETVASAKQDVVVSDQNLTEEVKSSELKEEDKVADNTIKDEVKDKSDTATVDTQDNEQATHSCNCDIKVEANVVAQEMVNLNVADNTSTVLTGEDSPVVE